jgi:hypothetical protein
VRIGLPDAPPRLLPLGEHAPVLPTPALSYVLSSRYLLLLEIGGVAKNHLLMN